MVFFYFNTVKKALFMPPPPSVTFGYCIIDTTRVIMLGLFTYVIKRLRYYSIDTTRAIMLGLFSYAI